MKTLFLEISRANTCFLNRCTAGLRILRELGELGILPCGIVEWEHEYFKAIHEGLKIREQNILLFTAASNLALDFVGRNCSS